MLRSENLPWIDALLKQEIQGIVLPVYMNERPLLGAVGILDWRMSGAITRFVRKGILTGEKNETTYIPIKVRGNLFHIWLLGAGFTSSSGRRNAVPEETWAELIPNLKQTTHVIYGIPALEFGGVPFEYFENVLGKDISACILN